MSDKISKHQQRLLKLRAEAEARLAEASQPQSSDKLLHELRMYQIELEMQNEELRRVHAALEASRDRYIELYEFAPIGYATLSREGIIAEINRTGAALLGVERKRLIDRRFAQFIADPDKNRWNRLFLNMMENADAGKHSFDMQFERGDGSRVNAHFECLRRAGVGPSPELCIAFSDITELKRAQADLLVAATAFESTQEGMFITDANRKVLRVNQAFSKITGYSPEEVIGRTPRLLGSGHHDAAFYDVMWEHLETHHAWEGDVWDLRKGGEKYPLWLTIKAVHGNIGELLHYVVTLTDITEQKKAAIRIEQLAFYDPLTNLPNRRLLMDRLHLALANSKRSKRYGALLFIDLDNFKKLNDTLGHDMGDLLLKQAAQRLLDCVRQGDTAARLGGDEFVVMLEDLSENPETSAAHVEIVGNKILTVLNELYPLAGQDFRCSASIGATLFYDHVTTKEDLLKHVDIAMYEAKREGRNTLCFFDKSMQSALTERTALEANLRLALQENHFKLAYQMQITNSHRVIGAEVFLRWQHPERGLISPPEFISLAEATGLLLPIGQWVLEAACAQLKAWENSPSTRRLLLAVNVCSQMFHQVDFVERVQAILDQRAIEPSRLKLELTEHIVMADIDDAIAKMQSLKELGVRLSLDDFGTGYSSLTDLAQLPIDQLKIDQNFVHNLGVKQTAEVIVRTIIGMADNLGMEVIAEGVETEAQRVFLEQHGCKLYQGHLFSKPVPLETFEQWLKRHSQW
ncbi:MAG: putative bifunctional diguanylate cyclase/phosphodiesterase [Gammaproteobacteria bacterium]